MWFVKLSPDRTLIEARVAGAILQNKGFNSMWVFGGVLSIAGGWDNDGKPEHPGILETAS